MLHFVKTNDAEKKRMLAGSVAFAQQQPPVFRPRNAAWGHKGTETYNVPFVEGTPLTRGSISTAWASARAKALKTASVT